MINFFDPYAITVRTLLLSLSLLLKYNFQTDRIFCRFARTIKGKERSIVTSYRLRASVRAVLGAIIFFIEYRILNLSCKMYFVVYLIHQKRNVVIPQNWIRDVENHIEKFMNYGVNSNQIFVCFYTNNVAAVDSNGAIRLDFPANFQARFFAKFPSEGLYLCQIKKFRSE